MADPYLTPVEVRGRRPDKLDLVSDDEIARLVAAFEELAEAYRGVAFIDRGQDQAGYPGVPYPSPPETILDACAEYVVSVATSRSSGTTRDIIAQTFEGGMTRYSTPDWGAGRPTGYLEVDRLLNSLPDYRLPGIG